MSNELNSNSTFKSDDRLQACDQAEKLMQRQIIKARQEATDEAASLLNIYTDREKQHDKQLVFMQEALSRHMEEATAREKILTQKTSQSSQQLNNLLHSLACKEQEFGEKLYATQQTAESEKAELLRMHDERQQSIRQEHIGRENALRSELDHLIYSLASREQEFGEKLYTIQQAAESEKAELLRMHDERQQSIRQEHIGRENALRSEFDKLLYSFASREQEYGEKLLMTQQFVESEKTELLRMHAEQIKALQQQFADTLAHHQQQHNLFRHTAAAFEEHLKQQIQSEQQAVIQLKQALAVLQEEMAGIRSSFSWWITSPLRKLAGLFETTEPSVTCSPPTFIPTPDNLIHTHVETTNHFLEPDKHEIPIESVTMPTNITRENVTTAKTVNELLSYYDHEFVRCTYLTLLRREPDSEGMTYYLGRLRAGYGKANIVTQIADSSEARKCSVDLPGLCDLVASQKKTNHWFWKIISRDSHIERQLNRFEYELGRIAQLLTRLEPESTQRLANLEHAMGALQASLNNMTLNAVTNKVQDKPSAPPAAPPKPDTSSFSLPAQRIFAELSQAVENSKEGGIV